MDRSGEVENSEGEVAIVEIGSPSAGNAAACSSQPRLTRGRLQKKLVIGDSRGAGNDEGQEEYEESEGEGKGSGKRKRKRKGKGKGKGKAKAKAAAPREAPSCRKKTLEQGQRVSEKKLQQKQDKEEKEDHALNFGTNDCSRAIESTNGKKCRQQLKRQDGDCTPCKANTLKVSKRCYQQLKRQDRNSTPCKGQTPMTSKNRKGTKSPCSEMLFSSKSTAGRAPGTQTLDKDQPTLDLLLEAISAAEVSAAESSKKGAKKGEKQRLAVVAASMQRGNECLRISIGDSNTPSNMSPSLPADQNQPNSDMPEKKKTRGKATLEHIRKREKPIPVDFNDRGQPIGDTAAEFASFLGSTARELVPVTIEKWIDLSDDFRDQIWEHITQKYILDDCHKKYTFQKLGKHWRDYKSNLIKDVMEQAKVVGLSRALVLLKPDNVPFFDDWKAFVKKRNTTEFKERSERFKDMRKSQTLLHTTSRKGYARLEEEMRQKSYDPDSIERIHVWIKGHQRKNGNLSEEAKRILDNIEETQKSATSTEKCSLNDDALSKELGPERRGRVRGLGFGVTLSKLEGQKYHRDKVTKLESEMNELKKLCKSIAEKVGINNMETGSSNKVENVNPSSCVQNFANPALTQIWQETENAEVPSSPKIGSSCRLLNWTSSSEVVAIGEIVSKNPKDLVHNVPLGDECYKVWVIKVFDYELTLYRPTREFFLLHEALSSTIAWPIKYIRFD